MLRLPYCFPALLFVLQLLVVVWVSVRYQLAILIICDIACLHVKAEDPGGYTRRQTYIHLMGAATAEQVHTSSWSAESAGLAWPLACTNGVGLTISKKLGKS